VDLYRWVQGRPSWDCTTLQEIWANAFEMRNCL